MGSTNSSPDHPLKGLFLVRSYFGDNPAVNVLELSTEEAVASVCRHGRGYKASPETPANERTRLYLERRRLVEDWLISSHLTKGGIRNAARPIYFRLASHPVTRQSGNQLNILCMPAETILPSLLSLTVEDSFPNFDRYMNGKPGENTVLTPVEFQVRLKADAERIDPILAEKTDTYVEAHVWTRDFSTSVPAKPNLKGNFTVSGHGMT